MQRKKAQNNSIITVINPINTMDTDTNSSWLGFLLSTLKMKSGVTSANITPSDRISNLGVCCLQQVLAFSGPLGVLSVASSSSHLFVTICSSASIFDELHFQAFGVYMRRGVGVGVGVGGGGRGGDGSSKVRTKPAYYC